MSLCLNLTTGQSQPFTATVTGTSNQTVTWSLSTGAPGSISTAGVYTAPSTIPTSQTITAIATSAADNITKGRASVTLLPPATVVSSLQCNPTTLVANASGNCTVTLSPAAGFGGAVVSLSSTGLPGLTIPGTMAVAANATTGSFPISTGILTVSQSGSVTASYNGTTQSVNVSLVAAATSTAVFVQTDVIAQGNWKSVYGTEGYNVIQDTISYPAYVMVTPSGNGSYTWAPSSSETRALQKGSSATDRIAACWFSGSSFSIDLTFKDANPHQVALYLLDWNLNGGGRTERVDILDGNGNVLDTRLVSGFNNGQYLVWNLSGHVIARITNTNAASNALVNGLFFGRP